MEKKYWNSQPTWYCGVAAENVGSCWHSERLARMRWNCCWATVFRADRDGSRFIGFVISDGCISIVSKHGLSNELGLTKLRRLKCRKLGFYRWKNAFNFWKNMKLFGILFLTYLCFKFILTTIDKSLKIEAYIFIYIFIYILNIQQKFDQLFVLQFHSFEIFFIFMFSKQQWINEKRTSWFRWCHIKFRSEEIK